MHKSSFISNRTNRESLKMLIDQIEQNKMITKIQKSIKKLKIKSYEICKFVIYFLSKTNIHINISTIRDNAKTNASQTTTQNNQKREIMSIS